MANILITVHDDRKQGHAKLLKEATNLICKVLGSKPETEGDRIRCGAVLITGPLIQRESETVILLQWPDGLYPRLTYELRAFAASQKIEVTCF